MTDGKHLGHVLGAVTKTRYGLEGASQIIRVETGDDDLLSGRGQIVDDVDQPVVEELALIYADYLYMIGNGSQQTERIGHRHGFDLPCRVRDDLGIGVAVVELGLEDLDRDAGDLRPGDATYQLLALATEHRPADDLDPPIVTSPEHVGDERKRSSP
jgi:hypothetical protein